jgi:acyl-CoA synthetase (NDP forming)
MAEITPDAKQALAEVLPAFASLINPIDTTGALLSTPALIGSVLTAVGETVDSDLALLALPVAGAGYDVPRFARDLAEFGKRYGKAVAMAAPQEAVRKAFAAQGVATFAREGEALNALDQVARHAALLRKPPVRGKYGPPASADAVLLNEADSLKLAAEAGIPVVEHRLCRDEDEARAAAAALGPAVAVKACSSEIPHKAKHGLVALNAGDAVAEFRSMRERVRSLNKAFDGVIVARMAGKGIELALGARVDPQFGPLVVLGAGGVQVELLEDVQLLFPPFAEAEVLEKLERLRLAPLLAGRDTAAFARSAAALGAAMLRWDGRVRAIDINPVILFETGGALAVDALAERIIPSSL